VVFREEIREQGACEQRAEQHVHDRYASEHEIEPARGENRRGGKTSDLAEHPPREKPSTARPLYQRRLGGAARRARRLRPLGRQQPSASRGEEAFPSRGRRMARFPYRDAAASGIGYLRVEGKVVAAARKRPAYFSSRLRLVMRSTATDARSPARRDSNPQPSDP
jgi:hypothetical protein